MTKKFSTATLAAMLAMWGLLAVAQVTPVAAPKAAQKAKAPAAPTSVFTPGTPDRYTVVKGDTLWGIAGRFLTSPWRWPEVWQKNRDQIKNPHWIYPGQVIVIDKVNGTMHLEGQGNAGGLPEYVLEPQIRVETDKQAISSIPQNIIEPFLTRPLVVDDQQMKDAPRIVAAKGDRVVLVRGDSAYVSGIADPQEHQYQVFRPGIPLKDPDTGDTLGYQADYLGTATVIHEGSPATVQITSFAEEINIGDRLVPAVPGGLVNYMPHAPAGDVHARIINTYDQVGIAGRGMIVSINRGKDDDLDIGTVLAVHSKGRTITDRTNGSRETIDLPDERIGLVFVFRLFSHVSYALVLNTAEGIEPGDVLTQP